MSKTIYDEVYSYEVSNDGYDIFRNNVKIISQHGDYGKPMDVEKSYEENAIMQIESLIKEEEDTKKSYVDVEKLRADLDFVAIMSDLVLPSEEEEE